MSETIEVTVEVFNQGYDKPALRIHSTCENLLEAAEFVIRQTNWYKELGCTVRAEVNGYTIQNGTVRNPGKFERETVATLYFYDCYLNGGDTVMELDDVEKAVFNTDKSFVYLAESNDGFVSLEYYATEEEANARDENDYEDDYEEVE